MQESQASHRNVELDAVIKSLQTKKTYIDLKEHFFKKLVDSKIPLSEWMTQIPHVAVSTQTEYKLKQLIYDISSTIIQPEPIKYDAIESINQARQIWTEFLVQNLIHISNKLLERLANADKKDPKNQKEGPDDRDNLFIFDHKNLYAACVSCGLFRSKRSLNNPADLKLSERCSFEPISISELKKTYTEVLHGNGNLSGEEDEDENLIMEREKEAEYLIQKGSISEMEIFARKGLPNGIRVRFYRKYLGIENQMRTNKYHKQFTGIHESMKGHKYIIDELLNRDILDGLNDDKYFIFDEVLAKTIWTFFRDKQVHEKLAILPIVPFSTYDDINKIIPCCGILPCSMFPRYALPFLFTSERAEDVYFLFREFYCKYFCFLNSLSTHPNSILSKDTLSYLGHLMMIGLCHLFEELFYKQNPKLAAFLSNNGFEPLSIAIQWIMYAFVGFLGIEQLFILFDRIIGYNSLEVVAILAVGVLAKKTEKLLKCKTRERIEEVCMNLKSINVVECLRYALPG